MAYNIHLQALQNGLSIIVHGSQLYYYDCALSQMHVYPLT